MPTLFRFLIAVGVITTVVYGGLFVMSDFFEPTQKEVVKPVQGVKIKKQ